MNRKTKSLLLIFGGRSGEHEVSVRSAAHLYGRLTAHNVYVYPLYVAKNGKLFRYGGSFTGSGIPEKKELHPVSLIADGEKARLSEPFRKPFYPDAAFPVIHGTYGEDGVLQGLLTALRLPFVGCDTLSSALGMHKGVAKTLCLSKGIPACPFLTASDPSRDAEEAEKNFSYPLVVKPASSGSSLGVSQAEDRQSLVLALQNALTFSPEAIIEPFLTAREIEVGVMEKDGKLIVSLPGEVEAPGVYDYDTKYRLSTAKTLVPAPLSPSRTEEVQSLALNVFRALHCRHYARVDFFLTEEEGFLFNEINTVPGFTSVSLFPAVWRASGVNPEEALLSLYDGIY
ncbi:MAG: D-alanine--D-alanine ligase [Clostridia bacterium]|nr:D-alanine--D-alanine ligase [Clostridia bacterium]